MDLQKAEYTHVLFLGFCIATTRTGFGLPDPEITTEEFLAQQDCHTVQVQSQGNDIVAITVSEQEGSIVSMEPLQEYSHRKCLRGVSYGFYGYVAYSDLGCRAEFKICQSLSANVNKLPGIITSTFTTVILLRTRLRKKFYSHFLVGVCVSSVGFLMTVLVNWMFKQGLPIFAVAGVCQMTIFCLHRTCQKLVLQSSPGTQAARILDSDLLKANPLPSPFRFVLDVYQEYINGSCESPSDHGFYIQDSRIVVFAEDGCSAVFLACQYLEEIKVQDVPNYINEEEVMCTLFLVQRSTLTSTKQGIPHPGVGTIYVISVQVVKQVSDVKCEEWNTFFVSGHFLTAQKGCSAVFEICYNVIGV